jgi:hypothetical protein
MHVGAVENYIISFDVLHTTLLFHVTESCTAT